MLSIRNKEPWTFWPTRVCPSFYELPGNYVLDGKYNFKLEIDFTLVNTYGEKSTILAFLPLYSSLNYYNEHMSNLDIHTENGGAWEEVINIISKGKKHKVVFENVANSTLKIFIDDNQVLETEKFNTGEDTRLVLGAGNYPWHEHDPYYCDLDLHEFKLYHDGELISHHLFDTIIYEKSFDITGNCNFIHKA